MEKEYKSIEVANGLGVSQTTVRQWVNAGKLKGYVKYEGKKVLMIPDSELKKFLNDNPRYREMWFNPTIREADHTMKKYIQEKLKALRELDISLTPNQLTYIWSRKTEFDVDAFAHDLIKGRPMVK